MCVEVEETRGETEWKREGRGGGKEKESGHRTEEREKETFGKQLEEERGGGGRRE